MRLVPRQRAAPSTGGQVHTHSTSSLLIVRRVPFPARTPWILSTRSRFRRSGSQTCPQLSETCMAFAPLSVFIRVPPKTMVRWQPTCCPSLVAPLLAQALMVALLLVVLMRPRPPTLDWTTLISALQSLATTSTPLSSPRLCARRLLMAPLAPFPGPRLILLCQCVWPGTPRGSATLTVPVLATTLLIP